MEELLKQRPLGALICEVLLRLPPKRSLDGHLNHFLGSLDGCLGCFPLNGFVNAHFDHFLGPLVYLGWLPLNDSLDGHLDHFPGSLDECLRCLPLDVSLDLEHFLGSLGGRLDCVPR